MRARGTDSRRRKSSAKTTGRKSPTSLPSRSIRSEGGSLPPASNDLVAEEPANPIPLAMFGAMFWCQQHPTNWRSLIAESAFEVRAGFRADEPGPDDTDTGWDVVLRTSWCILWSFDDFSSTAVDEAEWCEWGLRLPSDENACVNHTCTDGAGVEYPFTGCYKRSECYNDNVWAAVEYADLYLDLPDLMLAQVQIRGALQDPGGSVPECPSGDLPADADLNCGLAKPPTAGELAGASVVPGRPYLAWPPDFPGIDNCKSPFTWTHEIGHNFNGQHHTTFSNAPGNQACSDYKTLMNTASQKAGSCKVNWFLEDEAANMLSTCLPGSCARSSPYVDQHP